MNKRVLLNAQLRLISGMKRLQDMRAVFPEAQHALDGVIEMDFSEVLRDLEYLSEVES